MAPIQLKLNEHNRGGFIIEEDDNILAEMGIGITGNKLVVYHTEVSEKLQGQGIAKKLLDTMVEYARKNNLKVVALCPYVHAAFTRHPELYQDIWQKELG